MEGSVEENRDEKVIVLSIHDPSVELSNIDEWVETLNGKSWPGRMDAVRKKDWPKCGRLPDRKDDDSAGRRRIGDFLPRGYQFPDRRTDEQAFV